MTLPEHASRPPRLAHAVALLFSAHAAGLVVPLLTVPWLARMLGPAGWAPVLVAQALANWAILVLEFGFDLAGTRDVAQAESHDAMARTAAAVQRARLLLTPLVAAGVVGVALLLGHETRLIAGTVGFVVARGLSPYWFFQGKQRIRAAALIDTLGKVLPAAAMFALVRRAEDGWWVIALQAAGAGLATMALTWRVHRQHELPAVTTREALHALRGAAPMFAARAASGLYLQANTLILSLMAPVVAVATYGGAERIVRAAINLLVPLTQALFPRMSQLAIAAPAQALTEIRRTLMVLVGGAIGGALMIALLGNTVIALLLGPSYADSVAVLRVLVLAIPLVAAGTVLGIYWALPWRRERLFLGAILLGGAVNLTLAALLVPQWSAMGMATAVIAAETSVTTFLAVAFVRSTRSAR
jgi:PST family polysaccharide transporter